MGEGRGQRLGVDPAVDHRVRLVSDSSVGLHLEDGRLVVSLYSGSWIFARNLELNLLVVLEIIARPVAVLVLFL